MQIGLILSNFQIFATYYRDHEENQDLVVSLVLKGRAVSKDLVENVESKDLQDQLVMPDLQDQMVDQDLREHRVNQDPKDHKETEENQDLKDLLVSNASLTKKD